MAQGLTLNLSMQRGEGLIPGQAAKTPHALQPKKKKKSIKQKQYCSKIKEDFKNGLHQKKKKKHKKVQK